MKSSLLPPGFYDVLAPAAEESASAIEKLMQHFAAHGYQRVEAPLMEFEETLLSGPGSALTSSTFRAMDPLSQRMLGLRTDHTLQIGRIAQSRMAGEARPLRLSYAGPVVSALSAGIDAARQKMQVGVELIGSMEAEADAEAIMLGVSALAALGVKDVTVDLLLPTLMPAVAEEYGMTAEVREKLHQALDHKDETAITNLSKGHGASPLAKVYDTAIKLLRNGGNPEKALALLDTLELPEKAKADRTRLRKTLSLLDKNMPATVTVDLVETRCFEYQTGLSFSFYSKTGEGVLGRGGRYRTQDDEPATGFTFYAENLAPLLEPAAQAKRILIPFALDPFEVFKLQKEGYVTIRAYGPDDMKKQAKAQNCSLIFQNGQAVLAG
jgi:ATP phosphoribosyltransferase regulatory subunit